MGEWLGSLAGEGYVTALIWAVAALILLMVLLMVVRLVRNVTSGTFIAGGRNRAPRLAVVDATAVDSQRRLVLVRRDEVEHLILIGGPSDVVVEQQIRRRGVEPEVPQRRARRDEPVAPPAAARPVPPASPQPGPHAIPPSPRPERPPDPVQRPGNIAAVRQDPERRADPGLAEVRAPGPRLANVEAGARKEPQRDSEPELLTAKEEEEAALLEELDATAEESRREARGARTIEEEMSRLLENLTDDGKKQEN